MAARPRRIVYLTAWLATQDVVLGDTPEQLDVLEQWLLSHSIGVPDDRVSLRPDRMWTSVCQDIGLYLGDLLIARHTFLHWAFLDLSPKYDERFAPAVVGFPVTNKMYGPELPLWVYNRL